MKAGLDEILKSRWFAGFVHFAIWILLLVAVMGLKGNVPNFNDIDSSSSAAQSPIPIVGLEQLSSPAAWPKLAEGTNDVNPFSTKHFFPPAVTPPPAPTTRKFELTYQGFYQAENGPLQTM